MIDLITGHQGMPHISAKQISDLNNAMMEGYGADKIMRMKDGTITLTNNDVFTVNPGYWRVNGYDMEIQQTETIQIVRPTGNLKRYDDIYIEILRDIPSGAERAEIVKVEGSPATSNPSHPPVPTEPELTTDVLLLCIQVGYVYATSTYTTKHDDTIPYHYVSETEYNELLTHLLHEQYSRARMSSGNFAPIRVDDIIKLNTKGTWTHTDPAHPGAYSYDTYTLYSGNIVFQISSNELGLKSILVTTSNTSGYTEKLILFKGEVGIGTDNLWLPRNGSQVPSGLSATAIVNGEEYTVGTGGYYVELPSGVLTELYIQATSGISGNISFYPTIRYEDDPTYTSSYPPAPTNIMLWNEIRSFGDIDANIVTKDYSSVITLDDALSINAVDVKVKVEPVQAGSGTPSPDNVRAISGWSGIKIPRNGKNLLNPQGNDKGVKTQYGVTFTPLEDGSFLVNSDGAATGQARYYFLSDMVFKEDVIFSVEGAQGGKVQAWCNNKTANNPLTINANDTLDTTFLFVNTGDTVSNVIVKPMIRLASGTDTTYEPYQGKDYLISFGQTLYGAEGSPVKGVWKVPVGEIDLGDLNWGYASVENRFYASLTGIKSYNYSAVANMICSCYKTTSWNGSSNNSIFSASGYVSVKDSRYTDATQFKTAVTGQKLVYELATPYYINLTPTDIQLLQGQNTLYANSGDIYLEYRPNGIGNIGETLGELQNEDAGLKENEIKNSKVNDLENKLTSQVLNGVTYSVNADKSIDLNGTCNAGTDILINQYTIKKGTYKITGLPTGFDGGDNKVLIRVKNISNVVFPWNDKGANSDSESYYTFDEDTVIKVYLSVYNTMQLNNVLVKPMISLASLDLSYDDYVPYSKSNRELTEDTSLKSVTSASHTFTTANQWEYTDVSFTLTRPALVQVTAFWSNDYPYGVAISTSQSSANLRTFMLDTSSSATRCITAYLPAGTYYVWANYHSASTNTIQVQKLIEF